MEILDSGEGFSGNIMDDINQGLMEVKTAPNYPLPADAHCG
jgi:hypothetical protein